MNLEEHEVTTAEIRALIKDTNEQINKMAVEWRQRSQEIDKKINKVAGLFDTQWGKLMESLVEGGVLKLFQDRGVRVTEVHPRAKSHRNGDTMEVDLLLVNESDVVVIEVKTTLKAKHIRNFQKRMDKFFTFFPRYKEQTVYGGVAALRIEQEADRFAAKLGLFAIQVGGDGLVKFLNDQEFKPHNFA